MTAVPADLTLEGRVAKVVAYVTRVVTTPRATTAGEPREGIQGVPLQPRQGARCTPREREGRRELLVFRHRDYPEAGVQVPAGTVEPGEPAEQAVLRETVEETGLAPEALRIVRKLGVFLFRVPETGMLHERHVFHLTLQGDAPDAWDWLAEGQYVFRFSWVDPAEAEDLAGEQGSYLHLLG